VACQLLHPITPPPITRISDTFFVIHFSTNQIANSKLQMALGGKTAEIIPPKYQPNAINLQQAI
jgi:hypothetical protein